MPRITYQQLDEMCEGWRLDLEGLSPLDKDFIDAFLESETFARLLDHMDKWHDVGLKLQYTLPTIALAMFQAGMRFADNESLKGLVLGEPGDAAGKGETNA